MTVSPGQILTGPPPWGSQSEETKMPLDCSGTKGDGGKAKEALGTERSWGSEGGWQ